VAVPELAAELVELVTPAAVELGTGDFLEPLLRGGCEGDEQLDVGREQGLEAVCADLVSRTNIESWPS
jgi:hypothetical protein